LTYKSTNTSYFLVYKTDCLQQLALTREDPERSNVAWLLRHLIADCGQSIVNELPPLLLQKISELLFSEPPEVFIELAELII
jgi:hypothetical protein